MKIVVIGGGISGLAAAYRLTELLPRATLRLLEASPRLGGVLETVGRDGYLIERSADSFITKYPWATDLCQRLGIAEQLIPTDESRRRALVVHAGRLEPVPVGFVLMTPHRKWPILTTPILSWRGKLRVLAEPYMRSRPANETGDESVGAFAKRRLGHEAYERLVQPLLGGIHTADADRLSLAATFPEYMAQEQFYGRLRREATAGVAKSADSGARYGLFVAPREGVGQLVAALAAQLPPGAVQCNAAVSSLEPMADRRWRYQIGDSQEVANAVVVALPAPGAAQLVQSFDRQLAAELAAIQYASCAVVCLAYRNDQFGILPAGFGFVVPQVEQRPIIAASFASGKFSGRAPADCTLIRVFIGGALAPDLIELPTAELERIAHQQLSDLLQIVDMPLWSDVTRWRSSMPQYHVGHLQRVAQLEARATAYPRLALIGNAYHGVGIPQCIRTAELAAERLAAACGNPAPS